MKIMTGTVLFTLLMMPAAVIADVTHKVSGNVTITKYQQGDNFYVTGPVQSKWGGQVMIDVTSDGTYPFEISCEQTPGTSDCMNSTGNDKVMVCDEVNETPCYSQFIEW